jgi:hypothetical protein
LIAIWKKKERKEQFPQLEHHLVEWIDRANTAHVLQSVNPHRSLKSYTQLEYAGSWVGQALAGQWVGSIFYLVTIIFSIRYSQYYLYGKQGLRISCSASGTVFGVLWCISGMAG